MTSLQFAQHTAKSMTGRDLAMLPADVQQDLCHALNMTLAEWMVELPADRINSEVGLGAGAPVVQLIDIVSNARGFAYVVGPAAYPAGGFVSEDDALGCTVVIDGDGNLNALENYGTLLAPYVGVTAENARMTLYADCLHLPAETWGIRGRVRAVRDEIRDIPAAGQHWLEQRRSWTGRRHDVERFSDDWPRVWWAESRRPMQGNGTPKVAIKLWPAPLQPLTLRVEVALMPEALRLEDLFEARALPVSGLEESYLVAVARAKFLDIAGPLVRAGLIPQLIINAAASASAGLKRLTRPLDPTAGFVGTPHNF